LVFRFNRAEAKTYKLGRKYRQYGSTCMGNYGFSRFALACAARCMSGTGIKPPPAGLVRPRRPLYGGSDAIIAHYECESDWLLKPRRSRPQKMPQPTTYIGAAIKVSGTISAEEDLYIDGEIKGSVCVPGHCVTVGEMAYINAETVARELVIYGAAQGGLCGYDKIEIKKRASVAGDLATSKIVIEPGAHFKGVISTA
jgi:cytoskeletal protein CcmA (bactofilin family)